ncbi:MAG: N-acetylmuramoyl-L-alanine amidase [Alphaproteobacteria bacterium]
MKLIHKFKSLNYNKRNIKQISFLILHYTAISSVEDSIKYLCNRKKKVSCHYIISQNGKIYNLVNEKHRAWHAGQSAWLLERDLNSSSIGIELDFSPNHKNNKFSKLLIKSLICLLKYLKKKHNIDNKNILGHSDIAPYRKIDPGEKFPWKKLCNLDLSYNPKKVSIIELEKIRIWFKKNKIYLNKNKILIMLSFIGYDISKSIKNKSSYKILINNYKNHYLQKSNIKYTSTKLLNFVETHFCSLLLTKS